MGKKRPKKKPSLPVGEAAANQPASDSSQQQRPRKRGRPRKVVTEQQEGVEEDNNEQGDKKKILRSGEEQKVAESISSPSCADAVASATGDEKKGAQSEGDDKPKSRGRRKSIPRKST